MNGIKPKQSLGQNFLVDDNIARNIVDAVNPQTGDVIVEIGPGQGALTKHLVNKSKVFIAFEVDRRAIEKLHTQFSSSAITILQKDFLEADLQALSKEYGSKLRIIGNIPYHLTSEIFFKIIHSREAVTDATLMVQREVAQRILSKPNSKEYGILSVINQFYCTSKKLFTVSPNCFYPKPRVISTVLTLTLRDVIPYTVNESLFNVVVRTAFGKRRKMLRNSLAYLPFEETKVVRILARIERWSSLRPEQLSVPQFVELTNEIEVALKE